MSDVRHDLRLGDCLDVLRGLADCSVDAIVTDPPAGIGFMGKEWDHHKGGRDNWVAWMTQIAAEALRVAKPGTHALVWALPRTSHWTATAWEDAGWEVRDRVAHLFGSGFPKSLDVSKAIDRARDDREQVLQVTRWVAWARDSAGIRTSLDITTPATDAARQWEGWGTALKPAMEDWWLLRKPLTGTVAQNVQEWGTGALNIDGCRVEAERSTGWGGAGTSLYEGGLSRDGGPARPVSGRWPAHLTLSCWCDSERHDRECAVAMLDAQSGAVDDPGASRYFFVARGEGATIQAWNNATASDAQRSSRQPSQHAASAPSDAPIGAEPMVDATRSPSTSGTPNESKMRGEHATPQILTTGAKSSLASKPPKRTQISSPVRDAVPSEPTDTTMTMTSHSASAGSAGPVTSPTTQKSSERGVPDSLRFRYTAKASRSEREAGVAVEASRRTDGREKDIDNPRLRTTIRLNDHPTVKPIELMRWLCRLITPPGGLVLDCFMGSGTTGMAALDEGCRFLGIEAEPRYYEIAKDRIEHRHLIEVETKEPDAMEPQGRLL